MRKRTRFAITLGALAGAAAAVTVGWTFAPLGRLDYPAAIIARLSSLSSDSIDMTPKGRAAANGVAARLLPSFAASDRVHFEDRFVPSTAGHEIPVRIYTPDTPGPRPFYFDIHGGGWWMGNGFIAHEALSDFAARTDAIVVSVDYRLAPEYPFPAGLDDCETVLRWIAAEGASLGGDPLLIAIGGSSAGGNLSAALAIKMRDEQGPKIAFQFLSVPATDLSDTREWVSYDEAGSGYVLTVEGLREMTAAYVPNPAERMNPYVSPLLEGDLSGLPPALVVTALFDPLRDQGKAYATRLEAAGVPVELIEESALHGLLGSSKRARRVQGIAAAAVRGALSQRTSPVSGKP